MPSRHLNPTPLPPAPPRQPTRLLAPPPDAVLRWHTHPPAPSPLLIASFTQSLPFTRFCVEHTPAIESSPSVRSPLLAPQPSRASSTRLSASPRRAQRRLTSPEPPPLPPPPPPAQTPPISKNLPPSRHLLLLAPHPVAHSSGTTFLFSGGRPCEFDGLAHISPSCTRPEWEH